MSTPNKFDFVDALRGYAILGVIIVHTSQRVTELPVWLARVSAEGAIGVQLFYVISAFTLFYSMSYGHENEKNHFINFFIRRFFRIAPAFYIALVYYLWSGGFGPRYWLGDALSITAGNILSTVCFLNGWNPYWINSIVPGGWSVAVEMMFYMTMPLLYMTIINMRRAIILTFVLAVSGYFLNIFMLGHPFIGYSRLWNEYIFFWFPNQLPVFCSGIVLFYLLKNKLLTHHGQKSSVQPRQSALLILLSLTAIIYYLIGGSTFGIPSHLLYSVCFVMFAYGIGTYQSKILVNRFINYLGRISFSAYLIHFPLVGRAVQLVKHGIKMPLMHASVELPAPLEYALIFIVTMLLTAFFAAVTYTYIEKPGIAFGKKIISTIEKRGKSANPNSRN
jgi:peptidoglycan/LPS O-acetylase OafA/YrhL